MRPPLQLEGQRFGRWTVLSLDPDPRRKARSWLCQCDCGTQHSVSQYALRDGTSQSCGCLSSERAKSRPVLTKEIPPEVSAYCAGIIDGEGWITILKLGTKGPDKAGHRSPAYLLRLGVRMVHKPTILYLREVFGVGTTRRDGAHSAKGRIIWAWSCSTYDTMFVLRSLLPYLRVKKEEAMLALEFAEANHRSTFGQRRVPPEVTALREELYNRLRALKHQEWVD